MNIGSPELLIILVVVVLLFGAGRISKVGGELGIAIREFRHGLTGEGNNEKTDSESASSDKSA